MTDRPDLSRERVEALAKMLEADADAQNFKPCEMTRLLPDDENEIAATLRALLDERERDRRTIENMKLALRNVERDLHEIEAGDLSPYEAMDSVKDAMLAARDGEVE